MSKRLKFTLLISEESGWKPIDGYVHDMCGGQAMSHPKIKNIVGCFKCQVETAEEFKEIFFIPDVQQC